MLNYSEWPTKFCCLSCHVSNLIFLPFSIFFFLAAAHLPTPPPLPLAHPLALLPPPPPPPFYSQFCFSKTEHKIGLQKSALSRTRTCDLANFGASALLAAKFRARTQQKQKIEKKKKNWRSRVSIPVPHAC